MIEIDGLCKRYGSRVAVDELSLNVAPGEVFALIGPNGAGKTTTIKLLVGLLHPTSGSIRVCGVDVVANRRESSRLLGYVPDVPYLYDKLTGRRFLRFVGEVQGLSAAQLSEQVARSTTEFELADFIDDLTETYSHGMKHRLALAAALLHEPPVLVLDEPMVGLDPRGAREVKDSFCRRAAAGTTVLMSTHLLSVAEEISDRVGIVDRGRLRFLGTHAELQHSLAQQNSSLEELYLSMTARADAPRAGNSDGQRDGLAAAEKDPAA